MQDEIATVRTNKDNDLKYRQGLSEEKKKEIKENTEESDKPSLEYFTE